MYDQALPKEEICPTSMHKAALTVSTKTQIAVSSVNFREAQHIFRLLELIDALN